MTTPLETTAAAITLRHSANVRSASGAKKGSSELVGINIEPRCDETPRLMGAACCGQAVARKVESMSNQAQRGRLSIVMHRNAREQAEERRSMERKQHAGSTSEPQSPLPEHSATEAPPQPLLTDSALRTEAGKDWEVRSCVI